MKSEKKELINISRIIIGKFEASALFAPYTEFHLYELDNLLHCEYFAEVFDDDASHIERYCLSIDNGNMILTKEDTFNIYIIAEYRLADMIKW